MNLDHWLVDTVTVASISSRNSSGDPVFAAQRTVPARVQEHIETFRVGGQVGSVQRQLRSKAVIYCTEEIKQGDRCWLPGASTANVDEAFDVIAVAETHNLNGNQKLFKVML